MPAECTWPEANSIVVSYGGAKGSLSFSCGWGSTAEVKFIQGEKSVSKGQYSLQHNHKFWSFDTPKCRTNVIIWVHLTPEWFIL